MATAEKRLILSHIRKLVATHRANQEPDQDLLLRFASERDEEAFAALLHRHGPMVLRVCRRVLHNWHDAEDAFQATFLTLARRAPAIRKHASVASWLHGVAYRVSLQANANGRRRNTPIPPSTDKLSGSPQDDVTWRELRSILDAELNRLPEKYRAPLLLCYLEGQTRDEAAHSLGCPLGTLKSRLERGRDLLRGRLTRRGLTLSAALVGIGLEGSAASAALPGALARSTVQAAVVYASGKNASALVSAQVAKLLKAGLHATTLGKVKIATLALAGCFLFTSVGFFTHRATAAKPFASDEQNLAALGAPDTEVNDRAPAPGAGNDQGKEVATFRGRVLDPEGNPFGGAKLHLVALDSTNVKTLHVQTTGGVDGRFRISVPAAESRFYADDNFSKTCIVATAEGYGPAVTIPGAFTWAGDLVLRLARDDVPINGRVVDLQGRPLAGIKVCVDRLSIPRAGDLTPWLEALEANKQDGYPIEFRFLDSVSLPPAMAVFPTLVTDREGRFQLKGGGRERLVGLTFQGPTIVFSIASGVSVMTRPGKPMHASMFAYNPEGGKLTYYGATFEHPAAPSRPIVGVVRDKNTGKPLAGVPIQSDKFAGINISGDSSVRTVTDKDGRYRLVGMPKGEGNLIKAAPAAGQPYLQDKQEVANSPGLDPVEVDFALKRGVLVKGRVLDKATGKPVFANVSYVAFADNPRYKAVPGFTAEPFLQTKEDGTFELVAFPGRGLLMARGWNDHYRMAVGADQIKDWRQDHMFLLTAPYLVDPTTVHTLVEINPPKDAEPLPYNIRLDPGRMPGGTVVGPDGKPLIGTKALGLTAYGQSRIWTRAPLKSAEFTVYGLDGADQREVVFFHEKKRLAGMLQVRGNAKGPLTVKLEPWGTVSGRLVTAEGKPRAGVLLQVAGRLLPNAEFETDRDGRFRVEGLVRGAKYTLTVVEKGKPAAQVFTGLTLKAAEEKDLGDVQAKRNESQTPGG